MVVGAAMAAASVVGVAAADDISNNLDTSIDATAESMPLTVGGANGTTQLYVTPRNGDSKNGCNLTGSTTLGLSVSSSDTAVATVSPSSITFTSCADTKTLTVAPVAQGSATISVSQTSNTTDGTFNLAPATFKVNVSPPPNTAPSVAVAGVTGGASYNKGSVPAATCLVTDAEDGNSSFPATLSAISGPYASDGIGSQTASCSYTDAGGLHVESSETYSMVDSSRPTIGYTLTPANPDGDNGWYKNDVSLAWSVTEPESPNSLETTGCVDQNVTADQAATTYSCAATGAGGTADAKSVTIRRDATPPTLEGAATTAANAAGWHNDDVAVRWTAEDGLSGIDSEAGPANSVVTGEGDNLSATAVVADKAGNQTTKTVDGIKIDRTAPKTTVEMTERPESDWYTGDVNVTLHRADSLSGVATTYYKVDGGAAQEYTGTFSHGLNGKHEISVWSVDVAGNVEEAKSIEVWIDGVKPTINGSRTPAANGFGWNNSNVVVSFACSDADSGIVVGDAGCSEPTTLTDEGADQHVIGTALDVAGNTASATVGGINIDKTAPSVTLAGGVADGGSYYYGSVPAAPTCAASDTLSGLDGACSKSGYSTALGSHTFTATAYDKAGNETVETRSYTVLAWTLKGFYQPVDMGGVLNTVKGGSTVPLKFEIFAGATELSDTANVKSLNAVEIACNTSSPVDDIELIATGGTSLRYDATGGQFIYNWQTPKTSGKCYQVTMTTQDGSSVVAKFKTK